jgi:hypothetical protein
MVDTAMPAHGHSTAPKFDLTKPRELRQFFDELELLFGVCNMTDSDLRKKHACIYVDIDSAELWESLPQHTTGISFGEFRKAIHKLYPGSEDDRKWTISDMDSQTIGTSYARVERCKEISRAFTYFDGGTSLLKI